MASSSLIFFLSALSLLAAGAGAARPCKTLFISYTFSSSSSSSSETFDLPQIAASRNPSPSSAGYFAIYRVLRPIPHPTSFPLPIRNIRPMIVDRRQAEPSFGMSSLQERAKDILVVVAGLLFGVGCGALTGAIMYLAWSLFTNRYEICRYGDDDEEEEMENPKKMGYVKISESVPAKEGYEGH